MKNSNGVKLIWVVIIAIVALVAGFLIRGAIGGQGASVLLGSQGLVTTKVAGPVVKDPAGIVHLYWGNGACNIERWNADNNTWSPIGTLNNMKERDCHDFPPAPTNNPQWSYGATNTTNPLIAKGGTVTAAGVIDMSWVTGKGCEIRRYNDSTHVWDTLGYASGVSEKDCHLLPVGGVTGKPPISKTTPVAGSTTTVQVKSTR